MNFFLLFTIIVISNASKIIIPPPSPSTTYSILIMIQGASLTPSSYQPLLEKIQQNTKLSLWVGVSDFLLDTPNPLTISSQISDIIDQIKETAGGSPQKIFYAGHSLGGVVLSNHLKDQLVDGVILLGSFLTRSFRSISDPDGFSILNFKSRVLTIGAELDGLSRITRMAEAFYHSIINNKHPERFPISIIPGASHMQFASGEPPFFVKMNDLKPDISIEEAHDLISKSIASFIEENEREILNLTMESQKILQPIIDSLLLEGSFHILEPCFDPDLVNRRVKTCGHGSKWVEYAQSIMADFEGQNVKDSIKLVVDDNFHKVYDVTPIHLSTCTNKCDNSSSTPCVLNCITVSDFVYDTLDDFDTGLSPVSASEIRAKMNSRQRMLKDINVESDFHKMDEISTCQVINQKAIDWAMEHASENSLKRFKDYGQKIVVGEDLGPYNAGPLWIWNYMKYDETKINGEDVIEIKSPMMRTPDKYIVSMASGYHYCKLLSPARALEWIYVDGLRKNGKI